MAMGARRLSTPRPSTTRPWRVGLPTALHDVYSDAFGAKPNADELSGGLGENWAISDGYHKVFACCQYGHATIEATLKLCQQASHDRIAGIHIHTHWRARAMDNPDPATTIGAKFSMQHIAATAAVHGDDKHRKQL